MNSIDERVYHELAARLLPPLEENNFFNGRVEYHIESDLLTLIATLIVERDPTTNRLKNIVPVWWEFHWQTPNGEVENDFDWSCLKPFLLLDAQ